MAKASSMTVWAGLGGAGGMFMAQLYGIFSHLQDLFLAQPVFLKKGRKIDGEHVSFRPLSSCYRLFTMP
jgi:hypothetical protein